MRLIDPAPGELTSGEPVPGSAGRGRGAMILAGVCFSAAFALLAWWALRPLPEVDLGVAAPAPEIAGKSSGSSPFALDESAFRAPLWIAPPAPAPPPPARVEPRPEPPPPPMRLQILAIVRGEGDEGGGRALLYDPDADRPVWVSAGQALGARRIERVTADAVEIRDGAYVRTLALAEHQPAGTPLERALRAAGGKP